MTNLTITASLYQAHAPWLTSVLVDLDVAGLDDNLQAVTGTATLTVEQAGDLGAMLTGLAVCGIAWQNRQCEEYLAALRRKVRA